MPVSRRGVTAALLGSVFAPALRAQPDAAGSYSTKPLRIVVPYPAGGFNDMRGRIVGVHPHRGAEAVSAVVDNKSGAGTAICTQAVATSLPDACWRPPRRSPAPSITTPRARVHRTTWPWCYSRTWLHMNQIPHKGSTPMLTDLAGGQVAVAMDLLPNALPFIQSGKVRPRAIAGAQRSPLVPEIPTAAEAGVAGYEVSSWHGIVVPAGTPKTVVDKLNREMNSILEMADVRKIFAQQGVVPDGGTPAQFHSFSESQKSLWKRVIQQNHITAA